MITSHRIAEEKCSLLFTILERSGLKSVVCTILASFPDLLVRHPNTMEPWTKVGLKISDFLKILSSHFCFWPFYFLDVENSLSPLFEIRGKFSRCLIG